MTEPEAPPTLAQKLLEASRAVEPVEKRGRNQDQKYDYVMAEDVAAVAIKVLLSYGVTAEFEPTRTELIPITSARGNNGFLAKVEAVLIVTDADSGERLRRKTVGTGADYPGPSAVYKAMTGARKYGFLSLLGIPVGDDPDATTPGANEQAPAQTTTKPGPQLARAKVAEIKTAIKAIGLNYGAISLLLGSIGQPSLRAKSPKAIEESLRALSPEKADELLALINREADRAAEPPDPPAEPTEPVAGAQEPSGDGSEGAEQQELGE